MSLTLIMEDPDTSSGMFTHWILYNIAPATSQIVEGERPVGAIQAINDFKTTSYGGPRPPRGTHHYYFKLFALDSVLQDIQSDAGREVILSAMDGHIVSQAELVGLFSAP